jgi:hypothetical protein
MNEYRTLRLRALEARANPSVGVSATLLATGVLRITGTTAADEITVRQQEGTLWIDGTDILQGGVPYEAVYADTVRRIDVNGLAGDDVIFLGAADQEVGIRTLINAGAGNDWVYGGSANDTINGGLGNDLVFGAGGADSLYGQAGDDFLDDGSRDRNELVAGGLGRDWNADVVAVNGTRPADVRQRETPTCSFLASAAALAGRGYDFREWISYDGPNEVGTPVYSVAFWNGTDWAWQSVEFDGTLNASDTSLAAEGESWVVLMNRAWIAFRGDDGTAFPHEAILALTGSEANHAEYWDTVMSGGELDVIVQTLAQGGIVIAGTGPDEYLTTDILVADHAYSVQRVLNWGGEYWLELRNPMGHDGGTLTTGNRLDGIVYVTWDEFVQSTVYLAVA